MFLCLRGRANRSGAPRPCGRAVFFFFFFGFLLVWFFCFWRRPERTGFLGVPGPGVRVCPCENRENPSSTVPAEMNASPFNRPLMRIAWNALRMVCIDETKQVSGFRWWPGREKSIAELDGDDAGPHVEAKSPAQPPCSPAHPQDHEVRSILGGWVCRGFSAPLSNLGPFAARTICAASPVVAAC